MGTGARPGQSLASRTLAVAYVALVIVLGSIMSFVSIERRMPPSRTIARAGAPNLMSQPPVIGPQLLRITNQVSRLYYLGGEQVSESEFFSKTHLNNGLIDTR